MSDLTNFREARYFPVLDGLRAISVFLVMLVHFKDKAPIFRHLPGWVGVDIFFVLSGFLITTLLLREHEDTGRVSYKSFYVRRLFRIVPVYLLVLLGYCVVCYTVQNGARWADFRSGLPYYAFFLNEFTKPEIPFWYSWTLGIEEKFYLLWPCIAFGFCHSLRARFWTCLILVSACLLLPFQLGRSYVALLLGAALAVAMASIYAASLARIVRRVPVALLCLAVLLSFAIVGVNDRFVLIFDLSIAALITHLLLVPTRIRSLLAHPRLTWFGKRSYSMYLVHLLVLNSVVAFTRPKSLISQSLVLLLAYFATGLVAHCLYISVEEPARNLGKRLLTNPPRPSANAAAAN